MGARAPRAARSTGRRNNFDVIRLAAAFLVLFSHAFLLSDLPEPTVGLVTLGQLGVLVFFGVSGFLIAQSWQTDPRLRAFLGKRALRIFPALVIVSFVTAFVVGPLVSVNAPHVYFSSDQAITYALGNTATFVEYGLPGVFAANPITVVNGSLWTLHFEVIAYLVVAAAGSVALRFGGRTTATVLLAAVALLTLALSIDDPTLRGNTVVATFAVGALLYHWAAEIPRSGAAAAVAMFAFVAAGAAGLHGLELLVGPFAVAYAAIVAAYGTPPAWNERLRGHDLSYGIYLWGFLLQQLVVWAIPGVDVGTVLVLSVLLAVAVAGVSWLAIERPALKLKGRIVGARPLASSACPTPTTVPPLLAPSPSR